MTQAQKVFESLMLSKGYSDFSKTENGKYIKPSIQTRWIYFHTGWNMAKLNQGN